MNEELHRRGNESQKTMDSGKQTEGFRGGGWWLIGIGH